MVIGGVDVYPGHPCPHSTGQGCDDYDNRPVDPCINFQCGWVMPNSPLPDWLKPNEAKVIALFGKLKWRDIPVDLAVPIGKRIPPRALNWLKQFAEQHGRPLVYTEQVEINGEYQKEQEYIAYGPPEFQQEVLALKERIMTLWAQY